MKTLTYNNPAKTFLRRYRGLVLQQQALDDAIRERREQALSITARLKEINVQSNGSGDTIGDTVAAVVDAEQHVILMHKRVAKALDETLEAIESVPDELQKAVLLMRYVDGWDWIRIAEKISYEERQTFVIHGRALVAVNEWLEKREGK